MKFLACICMDSFRELAAEICFALKVFFFYMCLNIQIIIILKKYLQIPLVNNGIFCSNKEI